VGRDHELAALRGFVVASATDGGALLVIGEAGVGKSVLLEWAAGFAATVGVRVLRAAGVEFEAEVSFAGLHQLLAPLAAELSALPRSQRRAIGVSLGLEEGSPPDRLALVNAVFGLLRQSARDGGVLVLVDDLQWLDQASAGLLATVARRLGGTPAGFLGVLRSGEGSVFEAAGLSEIVVGPLADDAASALLAGAYPVLGQRDASRVLAEAQGNPLALIELPTQSDAGASDAGLGRTPVGRRLQLHFERRIGALPAATREQLLLTALDGSSGLFPPVSVPDLEPAELARLIRIHPVTHEVQFRHPLTRAAVVALSTDEERRWAHHRLADRYSADPRRHVWHLAEAATEPDDLIADLLEGAAFTTKARGDPVGAIGLLLRAAELSPSSSDGLRRGMLATYLGADVTGDLTDPQRVVGDNGAEGRSVAAAVAAAAYMVNGGGDVDTIHRLLLGALRTVGAPIETWDALLVEIVYVLESNCSFGARADLIEDFHAAVDRLGLAPPEILRLLGATFLEPSCRALSSLDELDALVASVEDETDHAHVVRVGIAAMYVDRVPACRTALQRVVEHGRAGGAIASAIKAFALLGFDGLQSGDWDGTLLLAEEGIALTTRYRYRLLGGFLQYDQAMIAAARGDSGMVQTLTDELVGWAAPHRIEFVVELATHARAVDALSRGEYETAYRLALSVCSPTTVPSFKPAALWVLLDLVESAVRSGRLDDALVHVADIEEAGVAAISPRLALITEAVRALTSPDAAFRERFERALAMPGVDRWPFATARIRLAYGERLRRAKATTASRAVLADALDAFDRLGATPWAARARAELRASGVAHQHAGLASAADLTPQQREIAELAAAGLTNRQIGERLFLSPRTVGAHLYQVFPKLGVSSRAALRDALGEQAER